ncbi:MAG: molecular chaperone DnaK [Deltaproteobacteria bacterium]|nr:molecular chaperone DnaK [Deltaproteobacteria bacterium]
MGRVIGIDLGTTYSCVAVAERDGPKVIPTRTGQHTLPSVVAVTESGKKLVGHLAKRQAITNARNTIHGAKRLIGRRWEASEVQRALKLASYEAVKGPHEDVRLVMGGRQYALPELSAMVLAELKVTAEEFLKEPVEQAVVTVPAYFNDNQRQATKDAGRIAGLDVLRIINEPTAAALAYGYGKGLEQKVAIFDLGGGTFDISILEIGQGVFEVLATAGDTFLGGEDFDERIVDWLVADFSAQHGVDLRTDKMALQRLRDAAEKAKIELSNLMEVDINLPFIYSLKKGEAVHLQRQLTRDKLNELTADLVERTVKICAQALSECGLKTADVAAVILVGGMTRMPKVQQAAQQFFGIPPSKGVHPDEVVACGASIQGDLLSSGATDTLLLDVTPHHLGIMVAGGLFDVLINKDTTIPTSAKKIFTTVKDGQTQVRIMVLQGESTQAEENELLGEFILDELRSARRGEVKVEVNFDINADGIVSVSAKNLETGRGQAITVTASSGLTEDEIREMATRNLDQAVAPVADAGFAEMRKEAEKLLADIKQLLPRARPVIDGTDFGADALKKADATMAKASVAIAEKNSADLNECIKPLQRTLSLLHNVIHKLGS